LAVKMRLTRIGRKKRPFYRIVVIDSRAARDARYIECVGTYGPISDPPEITVKADRVNYWMDQGAILTDTVKNIMQREGVIFKRSLVKKGMSEAQIDEEMKKFEVLQIEKKRSKDSKNSVSKKAATAETEKKEAVPAVKEEATPEAKKEAAPAVKEEATPEAKKEAAPAVKEEAAPEAEKEAAPAVKEEATPEAEKEAAPAVKEEAAPEAEKEAAPADKAPEK